MTSNPPPASIVSRLTQRSDDTAEAMGKRIKMYHDNVSSILVFYNSVGRKISGTRSKEEIFSEVKGFLEGSIPADMSGMPPRKKLPSPEAAQEYIKENLQPFLVQALAALARKKPEEPLKFLATWLIENNPNNPKPPVDKPTVDIPKVVKEPVDVQIVGESKSKVITKDEKPGGAASLPPRP